MSAPAPPAPMQRSITTNGAESQSESETDSERDSDGEAEDLTIGAPDMSEYKTAKNAVADMNAQRKVHLETMKRKRDEIEDFMIEKEAKFLRLEGIVIQFKKTKKISWNEKSLRQHVNPEGMLDLDAYKSNQTEIVEKMSIKCE